ncbi:trypsin-like serine protease [Streptomyces koyangensis]|uniref:trypsin-like serine protease n=1 Tax=Streptomyces koyangensis TaxID=188770 RepID=UPI003C2CCAB4
MSLTRPKAAAIGAALCAALGGALLPATTAHAVTGTAGADGAFTFTARLDIGSGDRACSGALVDTQWVLTAASCFADSPDQSFTIRAGKPAKTTTATIGRTDLTTSAGQVRTVVELVPRTDRDLVLARLNKPVTGITPAKITSTAPTTGETLTVPGYGRTTNEWSPRKLHTGTFKVTAIQSPTVEIDGQNGASVCAGDTGAPTLRQTADGHELIGINSRSWQGGCFGQDPDETRTAAQNVRMDNLGSWVEDTVSAAPITDFNGDGVEDIAIADAKASVGGNAGAGLVRIVHGGGKGTAQIDQDLDWVPGGAEAGDSFGAAMDTVDYNQDGYTDLVVAAPGEDLDGKADAGMADILYGGPDGLGSGTLKNTHLEQGSGTGALAGVASEAGDRMGEALAAGTTAGGRPWIVIGTPGEAIGDLAKAGVAYYVYGNTSFTLHQNLPTEVPGTAEAGDEFGASVAGDEHHFAIGAPGEAIGTEDNSGTVALFRHTLDTDGRPITIGGMDQDNAKVSGGAEAGDEFGAALSMTAYRPTGATSADTSMLAVGSPGEGVTVDGKDQANAGRAVLIRINPDHTWDYLRELKQGDSEDTVGGTSEAGDRMGESVTSVNTNPGEVPKADNLVVAVGTPGEAIGSLANAGAIHSFSMLGAAGDNDVWIEAGDGDGIPGNPAANHRLGESIHFTGTHLYAGMPYGPGPRGALHTLPIGNLTLNGTHGTVTTYQPGADGLPAAGTTFGTAAR